MNTDWTFTYDWRITDFSLCAHQPGSAIQTHTFEAQALKNTKWLLLLYPRGVNADNNISLFARRCARDDGPEKIKLRIVFQLLDNQGSPVRAKSMTMEFGTAGKDIGFSDFMPRQELFHNDQTMLQNDVLNLRFRFLLYEIDQFWTRHIVSRSVIPMEKLSIDWPVEDFSKQNEDFVKQNGGEECTTDIYFKQLVNHRFNVVLKVLTKDDKQVVTFTFTRTYLLENIVLKVRIVVIDTEGDESNLCIETKNFFRSEAETVWELPETFDRDALLEHLVDDVLSLRFEIIASAGAVRSEITHTVRSLTSDSYRNQLTVDMCRLYQEKEYTDIKLKAKDDPNPIPAHKAVLEARSTAFSKALEKYENDSNAVMDVDIEMRILRHILKYMYTDETDLLTQDETVKLYTAGNVYGIDSLAAMCSVRLQANLKVGIVCQILVLANEYQDMDLVHGCVNFISRYWEEVSLSDDWMNLLRNKKELANETREKLLAHKFFVEDKNKI